MRRIYLEFAFMVAFGLLAVITTVHSFNVSEQSRADDVSINQYGD